MVDEVLSEAGAPATGADWITRSRLETGHHRLLASLFGTVRVTRCAWRRPGAGNLRPADAHLSLPACRPSHAMARLAAPEAARGSFEAAHATVTRRCGPVTGNRQVEQAVVPAAWDIAAFYTARVPVPCTASTLLVISADANGIVMRPGALRPATAKAAARRAWVVCRVSSVPVRAGGHRCARRGFGARPVPRLRVRWRGVSGCARVIVGVILETVPDSAVTVGRAGPVAAGAGEVS